jgi:hypothetical protein
MARVKWDGARHTNSLPTAAKDVVSLYDDAYNGRTHLAAGANSAGRCSLHHGDHDERSHWCELGEEHREVVNSYRG